MGEEALKGQLFIVPGQKGRNTYTIELLVNIF
jgi:hypothetical protein